jgi:hypothetical protein
MFDVNSFIQNFASNDEPHEHPLAAFGFAFALLSHIHARTCSERASGSLFTAKPERMSSSS